MFKESNLVKIVTSLPHFSKSHPKNNIILIYDDEHEQILYANHHEKQKGIVPDLRLSYTGTDYKTSIKNDLNFLGGSIEKRINSPVLGCDNSMSVAERNSPFPFKIGPSP